MHAARKRQADDAIATAKGRITAGRRAAPRPAAPPRGAANNVSVGAPPAGRRAAPRPATPPRGAANNVSVGAPFLRSEFIAKRDDLASNNVDGGDIGRVFAVSDDDLVLAFGERQLGQR